jgi:glycopeptide antibiotics resistance protein
VRASTKQALIWLATTVYIVILLKLVLFKQSSAVLVMTGAVERVPLGMRLQFSNLTPFATISYYLTAELNPRIALENLAGNVILFMPLGFLVPVLLPKLRTATSAVLLSFAVSLTLEVVQLLTGVGQFDVDDLLLNVAGGVLGWLSYRILASILRSLAGSASL